MKNYIALFFLISLATFQSCIKSKEPDKPIVCCAPPKGFYFDISHKTKEGKNLFTNYLENNKGQYDTRRTEIFKVINTNDVITKEPLDYWVKMKEAYGNLGYPGLALQLPTDDKRVSRILIYLYPSTEVDTISYIGEGKYNFPETKNVFYNGACIEQLNLQYIGGSNERHTYSFTVTKPEQ